MAYVITTSSMPSPNESVNAECRNFRRSFGYELTRESTPEIFRLIELLRQHTDASWATALILAEINPDNSREILARGYALSNPPVGDQDLDRRGVSDSQRLSARSLVERLLNEDIFARQMSKAKIEFCAMKAHRPANVAAFTPASTIK